MRCAASPHQSTERPRLHQPVCHLDGECRRPRCQFGSKRNAAVGPTRNALAQIRDSSCNYEAFMNILKLTDKPAELEAVKDKVAEELQYLRSLDTAGDGEHPVFLVRWKTRVVNVKPCPLPLLCCLCFSIFRHQCHQEPDKQSSVCKEGV